MFYNVSTLHIIILHYVPATSDNDLLSKHCVYFDINLEFLIFSSFADLLKVFHSLAERRLDLCDQFLADIFLPYTSLFLSSSSGIRFLDFVYLYYLDSSSWSTCGSRLINGRSTG